MWPFIVSAVALILYSNNVRAASEDYSECGLSVIDKRINPEAGGAVRECEFRWAVRVFNNRGVESWGTVLDKRHILTELRSFTQGNTPVKVETEYSGHKEVYDVQKMIVHTYKGRFDTDTLNKVHYFADYNIVVLRLAKDLEFSRCFGPVCLPPVNATMPFYCFVGYWLAKNNKYPDTATKYKRVVKTWAEQACLAYNNRGKFLYACAKYWDKNYACVNNVAGPTVCVIRNRYVQFGVQHSHSCYSGNYLNVFTLLSLPEVHAFIKGTLNK